MLKFIEVIMSTKKILFSLLFLISTLFNSCDTLEPNNDIQNPPGYQENILWPSLAESPSPMFRGNPQLTGRFNVSGPINFSIDKLFSMMGFEDTHSLTSTSIGPDSTLYFGSSFERDSLSNMTSYLYSVSYKGKLKWKFAFESDEIATTPLISKDGTIFAGSYDQHFYAINPDGSLKWKYLVNSRIVSSMISIDKSGNLYFIDNDGILWSFSQGGELNWKLFIDGGFAFSSMEGFAFSPDGEQLYVPGNKQNGSKTIYAVSTDGIILWSYDNGGNAITAPVVLSNGDIILCFKNANQEVTSGIISINKSGNKNWEYSSNPYFSMPTVDKDGNIYFCDETSQGKIISIDYQGKFRWEIDKGISNIDLISDKNGIIYFLSGTEFIAINSSGNLINVLSFNFTSWTSPVISNQNSIYLQTTSPEKSIIVIK